MNESASQLQRSRRVTWRYGILVGIMAAVGLLAGVATAAIVPGMVTSTALVVLPPTAQGAAAAAAAVAFGEPDGFTATQEVIAGSNVVLADALPELRPAPSLTGLRHDIQISLHYFDKRNRQECRGRRGHRQRCCQQLCPVRAYYRQPGAAGVGEPASAGHECDQDGGAHAAARWRDTRCGIRPAGRGRCGGCEQTAPLAGEH